MAKLSIMGANTTTARLMLMNLLNEIERGPFTVSRVAVKAGIDPSQISRWRARDIEPRLSSIERLQDAHARLLSEYSRRPVRT